VRCLIFNLAIARIAFRSAPRLCLFAKLLLWGRGRAGNRKGGVFHIGPLLISTNNVDRYFMFLIEEVGVQWFDIEIAWKESIQSHLLTFRYEFDRVAASFN
jgi:hypothetical protein